MHAQTARRAAPTTATGPGWCVRGGGAGEPPRHTTGSAHPPCTRPALAACAVGAGRAPPRAAAAGREPARRAARPAVYFAVCPTSRPFRHPPLLALSPPSALLHPPRTPSVARWTSVPSPRRAARLAPHPLPPPPPPTPPTPPTPPAA
ncbi:hypothetical protein BU14_0827s0008, partial [Porphyra umbilicalis]